jgi:hypothetical protein
VKIPVLLVIVFLIGFLPTWFVFRARLWRISNKVSLPQQSARNMEDEAKPIE